jgi:alpha-mannosidase
VRIRLSPVERSDAVATLEGVLPPIVGEAILTYATRTGALARIDGTSVGAFDREHGSLVVRDCANGGRLRLEVELQSLPTNGLPSGPGFSWWLLNALSHPKPSLRVNAESFECSAAREPHVDAGKTGAVLWGHSHLDVAWLWTYEQTHRKAQRTFAIAADLLDADPAFVFMQSQPQLYDFVAQRDPELFARLRSLARAGRFDADVAAMWVEPDCNLPSGESLLRQMLHAHDYCARELGVTPSIAWLPDSFGFANTLPTLLAHCGIERFATTKLQWNDTTRFPYAQFVWRGPDGSDVLGALIDSYDGGFSPHRIDVARVRSEPIVAGFGDGGGGVTPEMLAQAPAIGMWQRPRAWFDAVAARRAALPIHQDELYLQYHRGVYTTHHDLKAHNAALERRLSEAEELAAWCVAVRAAPILRDTLRERLHAVWKIVLRNQVHDVLPGTSIHQVNVDARVEYERANELVERTVAAARAALPRGAANGRAGATCAPVLDGDDYVFDNGIVRARVLPSGAIVECCASGGQNVVAQANLLALYRDRPKKWEAWNIDSGYERTRRPARPGAARIEGDGMEIPFDLDASRATMRITLGENEPFLRVDLVVDWRERRTLLRVENWLLLETDSAVYGSPHGVVHRSTRRETPEERAKFEVPGQRFACVRDDRGGGLAILALDTYGWSARRLDRGGLQLGHSLLRGTTWPDPKADLGEHRLSWAYLPVRDAGIGGIEHAWLRFAHETRVRLFRSENESVLIVACKPAHDGDGVIVRLRECDGRPGEALVYCGGRMREAVAVDGLERPLSESSPKIDGEALVVTLRPFGLHSFRVRF